MQREENTIIQFRRKNMAGFFIGLFVGGFIGLTGMCIFIVSGEESRREEKILKGIFKEKETEDDLKN